MRKRRISLKERRKRAAEQAIVDMIRAGELDPSDVTEYNVIVEYTAKFWWHMLWTHEENCEYFAKLARN